MSHSPLLEKHIQQLQKISRQAPILDLACGNGRNGLYLMQQNIPLVFADVNESALEHVKNALTNYQLSDIKVPAEFWRVDFEQENITSLVDKSFSVIMVFRYLHRPLFEQIKAAIKPGGMIIYETFTEQQVQFGRPKNPDFLLKSAELAQLFSGWKIVHSFEGVVNTSVNGEAKQAIAQIVAIKPE